MVLLLLFVDVKLICGEESSSLLLAGSLAVVQQQAVQF